MTLSRILLYSMWILLSGIIISLIYDLILAYGGVEAVHAAIFYIALIIAIYISTIIFGFVSDVCSNIVVLKCKRK